MLTPEIFAERESSTADQKFLRRVRRSSRQELLIDKRYSIQIFASALMGSEIRNAMDCNESRISETGH